MNKRVFYSDNGNIRDLTVNLNKYNDTESVFDYKTSEDAIYVGARLPFNQLFLKVVEKNSMSSNMYVEVWTGTKWEFVNEVIDETGALSSSGYVTFYPDRDDGWVLTSTSDEGQTVTGLESVKVYDRYWIKITFDSDLSSGVSLSWVGNVFSDDSDLYAEYPDLMKENVLNSFKSGKAGWEEQHVRAAYMIEQDLIINRAMIAPEQILEREDYRLASVQKVAEIIFNAFGDDFTDNKQKAREEYQRRLSSPMKKIDKNANGLEDRFETLSESSGWLQR